MLVQIALGAGMIAVTTVIQGVFTLVGVERLRTHTDGHPTHSPVRSTLRLSAFVMWLFGATIIEVWAWALLYLVLGAFESLETAVYFSTVTFTTLGFGDITLEQEWRLLSSFEAANGLLMFGWSTALVFAGVEWVYRRSGRTLRPRSRTDDSA